MLKLGECNSSKYLPSPISNHVMSPRTTSENEEVIHDANTYSKFLQFLSTQHIYLLKKKLLEFRGTHIPI